MSGVTAPMTAIIPSLWTARSPATARRQVGNLQRARSRYARDIGGEYYNKDTGLFMIHKLTSQEAQSITAKIEPGIKESKAKSQEAKGEKPRGMGKEGGEEQQQERVSSEGLDLGEVNELVKHNEQVLMEHHKHKEKMNDRVSKTDEMIEKGEAAA